MYGGGGGGYGGGGGGYGGGGGGGYGGGGGGYGGGGGGGYGGGGFGGGGGGGGGLGANLREIRDWDLAKLPTFDKNFYYEHPDVTARSTCLVPRGVQRLFHRSSCSGRSSAGSIMWFSLIFFVPPFSFSRAPPSALLLLCTGEEDAEAWRKSVEITISGRGVPKPCMTFEEASMPSYVQDEVLKCGFDKPTPIQSQGWPMALLGRDMVGISKTGSGKTLAFLLPAMIHINAQVIVV
jgi:ATP-dependent RNA helicase DDX5/DBP2